MRSKLLVGIRPRDAWIAQILFFVFLVPFVVSLIGGGLRRPRV